MHIHADRASKSIYTVLAVYVYPDVSLDSSRWSIVIHTEDTGSRYRYRPCRWNNNNNNNIEDDDKIIIIIAIIINIQNYYIKRESMLYHYYVHSFSAQSVISH